MLSPFECLCGNFILPEPASYVFFYAFSNLRNLLYIIYTVNDIAAILGIGRATAYKLANSGLFKTIRIGNMIRISRKSFEDWLKMEGLG